MDISKLNPGTKAVWGGETKLFESGSHTIPIFNTVTFAYNDLDDWYDSALGKREGHIYSRNTNPTVAVLEEKMALLERTEEATSFSTGIAAISNTLFALLRPGNRVVTIKDTYGGTSRLFLEFMPEFGVEVTLCDTEDHDQLVGEIGKGCDLVYIESPTNPTLKIIDIARIAQASKAAGAISVIDNTFSSPVNQNPHELGIDLVIHSATKYLGGHSDTLCGLVCGSRELIQKIFAFREINGASLHAQTAYDVIRGMKTLELRVLRQNESALKIARYLNDHPKIENVFYPGLESHPGHDIARKQMSGFGGILSFELRGGYEAVKTMLHNLELVHLAASLGSVTTLAGPPRTTSHVELTEAQRADLGIPESLVRYSVGIENAGDLIDDLENALNKV